MQPCPASPTPEDLFAQAFEHHREGRLAEAEALYDAVLKAKPSVGLEVRLRTVWAVASSARGNFAEAENHLRRAVDLAPLDANVLDDLGLLLLQRGRLSEAIAMLQRAVRAEPTHTRALTNFGGALWRARRPKEATAIYRRVLELEPESSAALVSLALCLRDIGEAEESERRLREVLVRDPHDFPARRNLASLLRDLGRWEEAQALYRVLRDEVGSLNTALHAVALSPLVRSREDVTAQRAAFRAGLEDLRASPHVFEAQPITPPSFYLAYGGHDDRSLLELMGSVLSEKVQGLAYRSPRLATWRSPGKERKIRVAFVSDLLRNHTIGRLNAGVIARLDRTRFEVVLAHGPKSRKDAMRDGLDATADGVVRLAGDLADQRSQLEALAPDVIFYPDVGIHGATYLLAHARLAPVQAATWGHPETTGLRTVDYFVSSTILDAAGADDQYTERLVRLPRLTTYYEPPPVLDPIPSREALGLPGTGTLYGCPQSLFKLHPDFDAVLAAIAAGDPDGHIVLLEPTSKTWLVPLRERWAAHHPILLDRVRFMAPLAHEKFVAHFAHIDVMLDPLHFGGGNTFFEALAFGLPMVTLPTRFLRSRIGLAAYRQMGVPDVPVVSSVDEYVAAALDLGRDPAKRARLRAALSAAARRELYADPRAVSQFEAFLEAAVQAAGAGTLLPPGWAPPAS
ncbi:MAG: tetratricopeptide repeat protein [Phenylobacterium sp.]